MYTSDGYMEEGVEYRPRSWKLVQSEEVELDIRPVIMLAIQRFEGKPARQEQTVDSYTICLDVASPTKMDYNGGHPVLQSSDSMQNVLSHLRDSLGWLTGRLIQLRIDLDRIVIAADPTERVFLVRQRRDSGDCPVSGADAERICLVLTEERCIFSNGTNGDFSCYKFSGYLAHGILDAHAKGQLRPLWTRIGNCGVLPPEEGV